VARSFRRPFSEFTRSDTVTLDGEWSRPPDGVSTPAMVVTALAAIRLGLPGESPHVLVARCRAEGGQHEVTVEVPLLDAPEPGVFREVASAVARRLPEPVREWRITVTAAEHDRSAVHGHLRVAPEGTPSVTVAGPAPVSGPVLAGRLQTVLRAIARDPDVTPTRLPSAGEGEAERLLALGWCSGPCEPQERTGVVERFRAQAARTPDARAVVAGATTVTYRELADRSGAVAASLSRSGAAAGAVVGLYVGRSAASIVALLGVLRAGAAYLPLDPEHPRERHERLLARANARHLVHEEGVGTAPSAAHTIVLTGTGLMTGDDVCAEAGPWRTPPPSTPAYVLFTSGSTGEPKGVVMPRRSLDHHVAWFLECSGSPVGGRVLHLSSLAWDTSTQEIFPTLCAGGTVVVASAVERRDPELLVSLLSRERVERAIMAPQILGHVAASALRRAGTLDHLVEVASGGDALVLNGTLRAWLETLGGCSVQNHYGPTETQLITVYAAEADTIPVVPPLGAPVGGTRLYVLDERSRPVPVGVPGELHIAGPGLAVGYADDPRQTAERFVPDPYGPPGGRMYRSGDVVAWNIDGTLRFIGRADDQVKIRGHRVEPKEVEAAINRHPAVGACVVLAVRGAAGGTTLAGFVRAVEGSRVTPEALRAFLAEQVPGFMVPAELRLVGAMPLTANGKVDVAALRATLGERAPTRRGDGGGLAAVVAKCVAEVLDVPSVSPGDHFVSLGGDSLLAIELAGRCRARGLRVAPQDVLRVGTAAGLAELAAPALREGRARAGATGWFALAPSQADGLRLPTPDRSHLHQATVYATAPDISVSALREAVARTVAAHPSLRLTLDEEGGRQRAVAAGPDVDVLVVPYTPGAVRAAGDVLRRRIDPARGRLLAAGLVNGGPGRTGRLVLVAHQFGVDRVSWSVLAANLQEAYGTALEDRPVAVPAEETTFAGWVAALARYAGRGEEAYWLAATEPDGEPAAGDAGRPNLAGDGAVLTEYLDEPTTRLLLRELPARTGLRGQDVVVLALADALASADGEAVRVDLLHHGREEPIDAEADLAQTTGWFTATVPRRPVADRRRGGLARLRDFAEQAPPHGGVGYGALRYFGRNATLLDRPPASVCLDYAARSARVVAGPLLTGVASEDPGPPVHPGWRRPYPLEVQCEPEGRRLAVHWIYGTLLHRPERVRGWAIAHREAVGRLLREATALSTDRAG
jgi:amino acid adenylation domain-containing protein